ncbi:MAG TPA: hypothetical protein PKV73_19760, partial [Agriterribacter sp.]|nr:hypothetical protein [Agriterribacter sp.]
AEALSFVNVTNIQNYFKRLNLGGVEYEIFIEPTSRTIVFQWISAGVTKSFVTTYIYKPGGIIFESPLINGSQTIAGFSAITWNDATQKLTVKSGNQTGSIAGAIQPLKIDLNAPKRWWQTAVNNETYWESFAGFHVNGVDDAFKINTLGRFYSLIYWPEYESGVDLYAPVFINNAGTGLELQYGAAINTPQFTPDGRAVFTILGAYGDYPNSGPAFQSLIQLLIPQGYYFIQTSASSYDMVSALDAKTWITWNF